MDKVKKFLEAYVQWLALALGVGFLGWMLYSYVFLKPVSSAVGNLPSVPPSDISSQIWSQVGEPLKGKVDDRSTPAQMGPTTNYVDQVQAQRDSVPASVAVAMPVPFAPIPVSEDDSQTTQIGTQHNGAKITRLPDAAAPINLLVSAGHSNVPAPVPAAADGAPAPQGANAPAVDRNWRTVGATIHTADLAKSFAAAGIAPGTPFSSTAILRVILTRQERKTDGTWGSDTTIEPLDINPLPALPPINASFADQKSYLEDFAEKNFVPIARPLFYQVLQGDVWYEPGTKNPNEALQVIDDGYDPKDPGAYAGDINKLLPSEQKLVTEAKARQAAKEAQRARSQNNRNNQPAPPQFPGGFPGGGPPGFPGGPVVNDPQRPQDGVKMFAPNELPPGGPGYFLGGAPQNPGMGGPPGGPPFMPPGFTPGAMPQQQAPGDTAVPNGSFDPSQQPDFKVWVHDVTVQAGKTYRYQLKYIISNPVARTSNLCNPPELAKQFYIESRPTAWSDPVSVESDTNFYAVEMKHGVHFDVFKWKNGIWQMEQFTANTGDMVGGIETNTTTGTKTDFTTGWTLVDIREDPSNTENKQLVLVSDNGTVLIKELAIDAHSPEYRRLYLQVNDPKNKPAVAGVPPQP
jgi:hypothetical protein